MSSPKKKKKAVFSITFSVLLQVLEKMKILEDDFTHLPHFASEYSITRLNVDMTHSRLKIACSIIKEVIGSIISTEKNILLSRLLMFSFKDVEGSLSNKESLTLCILKVRNIIQLLWRVASRRSIDSEKAVHILLQGIVEVLKTNTTDGDVTDPSDLSVLLNCIPSPFGYCLYEESV